MEVLNASHVHFSANMCVNVLVCHLLTLADFIKEAVSFSQLKISIELARK